VHKPTFDVDAASILFNLSGYRVVSATPGVGVEQPRQVLIETTTSEGACPFCGVLSSRIQARPTQRVKDVPCGGERLDVLVRKRRYACRESLCPRRSFTEETEQLPARARVTTRLTEQVISACRAEPRAVSRVAHEAHLSWPTVMTPPPLVWLSQLLPTTSGINLMVRLNQMDARLADVSHELITLGVLLLLYGSLAVWRLHSQKGDGGD